MLSSGSQWRKGPEAARCPGCAEPGSGAWYEARYHQIALLADIDPARARIVMDQHRTLNPDYGPEPWASRLAALDKRKADLVKLRFFAGLTNEQAARVLGISSSTADNDWAYARSWLRLAIRGDSSSDSEKPKSVG